MLQDAATQDLHERSKPSISLTICKEEDSFSQDCSLESYMEGIDFLSNPIDILGTSFALTRGETASSGAFYELSADTCIKSEECINLNPLLSNTLDEFSNSLSNVETPCDINIKNTTTLARNYKNDNTRYSENQFQSIVNMGSPNISSIVDDYLILNPGDELIDMLNGVDEKSVALSPDTNNIIFNELNNETVFNDNSMDYQGYYTPANSLSPPPSISRRKNVAPTITLDVSNFINTTNELSTPNIIDYIDDMFDRTETLDDVETRASTPTECSSSLSDICQLPTTNSVPSNSSCGSSNASGRATSSIKSGRRKKIVVDSDYEYDSDQDYVPPLKSKRSSAGTSASQSQSGIKFTKRGRPPKRNKSISSDDYSQLDPDEAKYREMRDRNNESSRKSRYKRKQTEHTMSHELDILENENIRLKTQVEELQKTVDGYRDNLMKVMLHKK